MSKLRQSAKGQSCLVRIPGICNHDPETTVLAHLPGGGMGRKQPDIFGAFCCSSCHDLIDGRVKTGVSFQDELKLMHYQGVQRTQQYWLENGFIGVL